MMSLSSGYPHSNSLGGLPGLLPPLSSPEPFGRSVVPGIRPGFCDWGECGRDPRDVIGCFRRIPSLSNGWLVV